MQSAVAANVGSVSFIATSVVTLCLSSAYAKKSMRASLARHEAELASSTGKKDATPFASKTFRKQILKLVRIVLPTWYCKEALILYAHTTLLFARTFL